MESVNVSNDKYKTILEHQGFCVCGISGSSMMPMLRMGKDTIVLEPIKRKLKKYDVIMFKRPSTGKYVCHRIIKIKNGNFLICGDNQWQREYGIKESDIIGILTGFYRKEKYISVNNFWYKIYYHFIVASWPIRMIKDKCKCIIKRILKRGCENGK